MVERFSHLPDKSANRTGMGCGTRQRAGWTSIQDFDASLYTCGHNHADTCTYTHRDAGPGTHSDTDPGAHTDSYGYTHAHADSHRNADSHTHTKTHSDAGSGSHPIYQQRACRGRPDFVAGGLR